MESLTLDQIQSRPLSTILVLVLPHLGIGLDVDKSTIIAHGFSQRNRAFTFTILTKNIRILCSIPAPPRSGAVSSHLIASVPAAPEAGNSASPHIYHHTHARVPQQEQASNIPLLQILDIIRRLEADNTVKARRLLSALLAAIDDNRVLRDFGARVGADDLYVLRETAEDVHAGEGVGGAWGGGEGAGAEAGDGRAAESEHCDLVVGGGRGAGDWLWLVGGWGCSVVGDVAAAADC